MLSSMLCSQIFRETLFVFLFRTFVLLSLTPHCMACDRPIFCCLFLPDSQRTRPAFDM